MKLIHTSPSEIKTIDDFGRFGGFLFFSGSEYAMTAGSFFTYAIDLCEEDLIDAEQLFYHEDAAKLEGFVGEVMSMAGCDENTAEELISQRVDVSNIDTDIDPEDLADISWDIQRITGEAAVALGFRGVAMDDEQGRAFLVAMNGRESELFEE